MNQSNTNTETEATGEPIPVISKDLFSDFYKAEQNDQRLFRNLLDERRHTRMWMLKLAERLGVEIPSVPEGKTVEESWGDLRRAISDHLFN